MKTFLSLAAVALMSTATVATAGTIQAEVRSANVLGARSVDAAEYRIEYTAPITSTLNYGAELEVNQNMNRSSFNLLSARFGPTLPTVLGFKTEAYGEVGRSLTNSTNFGFWGASLRTTRQVYGPISVTVGYRHREDFSDSIKLSENRLNAGLGYDLTKNTKVNATFYRTSGTTRTDAVGVALVQSF